MTCMNIYEGNKTEYLQVTNCTLNIHLWYHIPFCLYTVLCVLSTNDIH